jgi:hypothetical protein
MYDGDITHLHQENPEGYDQAFCTDLLIKFMTLKGQAFDSSELEKRVARCRYYFHVEGETICTRSSSTDVEAVISNRRASFR